MAAKRSRKARKQAQEKLRHAPPAHLLEQGRQRLAAGDARGALELLRLAQRGDGSLKELPLSLFCACALRARQLAEKSMVKEAAAMREVAAGHRVAISPQVLTPEELTQYLGYLDGPEALQVYAEYLRSCAPLPALERTLADVLVVQQCWKELERYPEDHPLRSEALVVRAAVAAMDAGAWEQAGAALKGMGRRSPYASWRLFCKGMVCFGAGDDQGLRQILALLPADFPLAHTVAEWRRLTGTGKGQDAARLQVQQALGTTAATAAELADQLRQAIWKQQWRDLDRLLPRLAELLYPEEPFQARLALLEIMGLAVSRINFPVQVIHNLAQRLVPRERLGGVMGRIGLQVQVVAPGLWNLDPASLYLDQVAVEFPEARLQALARGKVLETLARVGHQAGVQPDFLPPPARQSVARLLGAVPRDPGTLFADLMVASLAADPDNLEGYRFLLELLRGQDADRSRLEGVLTEMASRFPDEPQPCLGLATLHYGRNAYRQAEAALAEARRRAPHDERILDLQAIGCLRSADQNRKRGHFPRAAEDLQRAAQLGRPRLAALVEEKQLMLEVVSAGDDPTALVTSRLAALPPLARLRCLLVLAHDLEENRSIKNVPAGLAAAVRALLDRRADQFDQLSPGELVELLSPLEEDFAILFESLEVAPVLEDRWTALMARASGEDLIALFDLMLESGGRAAVRAELERRLRGMAPREREPLLLFYLAVIRFQEGKDHDARRFKEVLSLVDETGHARLRQAAMRLSRQAQGPLRQALQEFNFEHLGLGMPPFLAGGGMPPLAEILAALAGLGAGEGGREPPLPGDELLDELDELEELIDESDLRGAPPPLLREFASQFRSRPQARQEIERVARQCEAAGLLDGLSRELFVLLYPRRRRDLAG